MTAARTGRVESVRALIARGAQVNVVEGWRKQTALMWAAAEGHRNAVKVLVEPALTLKREAPAKVSSQPSSFPFAPAIATSSMFSWTPAPM